MKNLAVCLLLLMLNISRGFASPKMEILNLRSQDHKSYIRFVVDTSQKPVYKTFELHAPERVVIDINDTDYNIAKSDFEAGRLIDSIRTGKYQNGIRIVLDINTKAKIVKHFIMSPSTSKKNWRIVVDIDQTGLGKISSAEDAIGDLLEKQGIGGVMEQAPDGIADDSANENLEEETDNYDDESEQGLLGDLISNFVEDDEPAPKVISRPSSVRAVRNKTLLTDSSVAVPMLKPDIEALKMKKQRSGVAPAVAQNQQKYATTSASPNKYDSKQTRYGNSVRYRKYNIVIDAGHGGKDPGTIGRRGTKEKVLALQYAKILRDEIQRTGRYNVYLTRKGDYFISLNDRVKRARKLKADLFISIHADHSSNGRTRGLSLYTLSQKASDTRTAKLAKTENKADIIGGLNLYGEHQDTINVLVDMSRREAMNSSAKFAEIFAKELKRKQVKTLRNPHKYGNFAVLLAPDTASILVEVGFLSSRADEETLKTWAFKQKFANGMVNSLDRYFRSVGN